MNNKILDIIVSAVFLLGTFATFHWGIEKAIPTANDGTLTVVIDPGHGGIDPGKVGTNGERESDINLAISAELAKLLTDSGYTVYMTREEDIGLYSNDAVNKKADDMRKRCELIGEYQADVVVSIHQNSFSDRTVHGAQVFYYTHSEQGRRFADILQNSIRDNLDDTNNKPCKANNNYYMLVHTPCPTVIVECGFLSNEEETQKLLSEEYRQLVARAIKIGVDEFFSQ